ncbi:hypothetical protein DSL72_006997 [Monilinia vaccinii-corymbosi]|uniref:Zn(2)-C6 fungal-type domain-containing protein n=1 Tax=Monilinia vaccinii-corymbosi TaxID=61207 RepID=A0A8A3PLL7_9HELO|nr:hypothetical protein DSL72_006997 [Monilinia vaccinii-corymbosi]
MSFDNTPTTRSSGQRRAHTKSSNGCAQCKARRVKCDEIHPTCSRCARRSAPCSFLSSSNSPIGSSVQSSPISPALEFESTRTIELKLMHHYSTSTSILLAQDSTDIVFQNTVAINLAFSNPFLMNAFMATAALHLSTVETDKSRFWIHTALQYHNKAITGLNEALKNPASSNLDALSLCSMAMVINSQSLSSERSEGEVADAVAELVRTRRLLQGVILCLNQTIEGGLWNGGFDTWKNQQIAKTLKTNDRLFPTLVKHFDSLNSIPGHWGVFIGKFSNFNEFQLKNNEFHQTTLQRTKEMANHIEGLESEHKDDYANSCTLLLEAMECFTWQRGHIMAWPMLIRESMVSLLEAHDDVASLIFIHYGVALYLSTLHCFSKGAGKLLVETLSNLLEGKRPEWIEVLHWARASVLRDM